MTDTNNEGGLGATVSLQAGQITKLHSQIIESNKQARSYVDTEIGKTNAQTRSTSDVLEQLSTDFLESHNGLSDQFKSIEALVNRSLQPAKPDRAEIYTALAKAQEEIENADANIENEFLNKKYADLASCLNAVRGPLSRNGIALIQLTEDPGQGVLGIRTILAHTSGQTIEDVITMSPPKLDPQGVGSCRTYMRRYSLIALCGIAGALDDDAEGTKKDPNDYDRIETSEVEKIIYHADELFDDHADDAVKLMLERVFGKIAVVGDIRAGEMQTALTYLDNAKEARDKREAKAKAAEKAAAKAAKEEK
jgi:hypothetical protein